MPGMIEVVWHLAWFCNLGADNTKRPATREEENLRFSWDNFESD